MKVAARILASCLAVTVVVALILHFALDGSDQTDSRRSQAAQGPDWQAQRGDREQERAEREWRHLVVAVLSARGHFDRRQIVRDTWLAAPVLGRRTHSHRSAAAVHVDFVLGSHACPVPDALRRDEFTCERKAAKLEVRETAAAIASGKRWRGVEKTIAVPITKSEPVGVDFEFTEDAVITHLGVYDHGQDGVGSQLPVYVCDSVSGKVIVDTVIGPGDVPDLQRDGAFLYKPVTNFGFPKGFLGSVVAGNFSARDPALELLRGLNADEETCGLMRLRRQSRRGGEVGLLPVMVENVVTHSPRFLAASFRYMQHPQRAADVSRSQEAALEQAHRLQMQDEETALLRERAQHDDIALVPVTDTYKNLSRKLLLYFAHITQHMEFDYLLKTDDDCLVNVSAVLHGLASLGKLRSLWWGRFRREWGVERFGKWQEVHFEGKVYPPFACGSGNVLSHDLVGWLAMNREHLHAYQGEDVSMGIWLAALGARHMDDERWHCSLPYFHNSGNRTDFLAIPNLNGEAMRALWTRVT